MDNSRFFANTACPYYPCHHGVEEFSCMFCYCPLYALGEKCGGNFTYTADGIKDCSNCLIPHKKENYELIAQKAAALIEMARKK